MRKKIFLIYLAILPLAIQAKPIETWLDLNYEKKLSKTTTFIFEQELEWEKGFNNLFFYYFEPIIAYSQHKNLTWGFGCRSVYVKRDKKIKFNDNRPYFWIKPSFKLWGFKFAYRAQLGLRIRHKSDTKKNHGFWRSSFWWYLIEKKPVSFFVRQDWYYNFHNTQNIDSLLTYFWLNFSTHKNYYPYLYVCYYRDKVEKNKSWGDSAAIAIGLNASF